MGITELSLKGRMEGRGFRKNYTGIPVSVSNLSLILIN